jgi:uncharacterized protein
MAGQSRTPAEVSILPRNREHDIGEALAQDWYDNHAFKTAWHNAMSITFPLGEKFFIDSVRHFSDQITDPKLKEDIRGFCGQEGFHRREHDRYNQLLCQQRGYDLEYMEGRLARNIALMYKHTSPLERLAATASLEHITAILAEAALAEDSSDKEQMLPMMLELWHWHAAEELEHKSVAFDVYRAVGGTEQMRRKIMRRAVFFLLQDFTVGTAHMLKRDGNFWKAGLWLDGLRFLFGRQGIYRRVWPAFRNWFEEGFHPWDRDTRELLDNWQRQQDTEAA